MFLMHYFIVNVIEVYLVNFCSLDLDAWINEPPSESSDDEVSGPNVFVPVDSHRWAKISWQS